MSLLLIVVLVWLGFFGCLAAWRWARRRHGGDDDPFLAATSGPVADIHGGDASGDASGDAHGGDPLDDTLRQLDEAARDRQRAALRQRIARGAPKALGGFALLLMALLVASQLGVFSSGRERRRVSDAAFGLGTNKRGFSWGNKKFYARAGQSVVVSYALESGAGRLYLSVDHALNLLNPQKRFGDAPLWSQSVQTPGQWSATVPVPANGWYQIYIAPWPARGGSLLYDVRWKVQ